jgi:hypothetical protein
MTRDLLVRFVVGGAIVAVFSVFGDLFRPKTFAGIFGAAPSLALATLGLTYLEQGAGYAALEGRSMIAGAVALSIYSLTSGRLALARALPVWLGMGLLWSEWLAVAVALWAIVLRAP